MTPHACTHDLVVSCLLTHHTVVADFGSQGLDLRTSQLAGTLFLPLYIWVPTVSKGPGALAGNVSFISTRRPPRRWYSNPSHLRAKLACYALDKSVWLFVYSRQDRTKHCGQFYMWPIIGTLPHLKHFGKLLQFQQTCIHFHACIFFTRCRISVEFTDNTR